MAKELARRLRPERKQLFPETSSPSTLPTSPHALWSTEQPGPVGWGPLAELKKKKGESVGSGTPRVSGFALELSCGAARPRPSPARAARSGRARSRAWAAGGSRSSRGGSARRSEGGSGAYACQARKLEKRKISEKSFCLLRISMNQEKLKHLP